MKEAAGEANLTVITIILIGVIVAVMTPIISGLMSSTEQRSCCVNDGGEWSGGKCSNGQTYSNDCMSKNSTRK